MRTTQYEYDTLFDADNRNEEAFELSAKELHSTIRGDHMRSENDIVREWYYKRWISYKTYLKLTGLAF